MYNYYYSFFNFLNIFIINDLLRIPLWQPSISILLGNHLVYLKYILRKSYIYYLNLFNIYRIVYKNSIRVYNINYYIYIHIVFFFIGKK